MTRNPRACRALALVALAAATAGVARAQETDRPAETAEQALSRLQSQLTPAQVEEVKAIVAQMLAERAAAPVDQIPPQAPPAPSVATSWSGGSPRTAEEDRSFKLNGRVMYDVFNLSTDGLSSVDQNYARSYVRRAFLGVEGQFTQNWKYNIKLQFAPGADQAASTTASARLCQNLTSLQIVERSACLTGEADRGPVLTSVATSGADTEVGFDDAFIQYVLGDWEITLGQNNQVSPMEDPTSSLNIPFNERSSYINAFGFAKTAAIAVTTSGGNWSAGAAIQGDDFNNPELTNTSETIALGACLSNGF